MIRLWVEASRPKTWVASLAPVWLGTSLGIKEGCFSFLIFFLSLFTALTLQIGTNLTNDCFDFLKGAYTLLLKGPRRVTQAGLISISLMKKAMVVSFIVAFLLGSCLIFVGAFLQKEYMSALFLGMLLILSICLGVGYTIGPLPLAYLGIADFFVLFFFGSIPTVAIHYLQTQIFSWEIFIIGLSPGLLSTAILTVNQLRDREEDRLCCKKTLSVRWGECFSKIEYSLCVCVGIFLPFFYGYYLPLLTIIPAFPLFKKVWMIEEKRELNLVLEQTGKLLLHFCILFSISVFVRSFS